MLMRSTITALLAGGLLLVAAGCGAAPATSPGANATPGSTLVPSTAGAGEATPPSAATPVPPAGTPVAPVGNSDLLAFLPQTVGGKPVQYTVLTPAMLQDPNLETSIDEEQIGDVLERVNGSLAGTEIVIGFGENVIISTLRVQGATGQQLVDAWIATTEGAPAPTQATFGNKTVLSVPPTYFYASGDAMFSFFATEEHAAEVVSRFP